MSINEFLNILVLSLSLATVFITLLTYLIHKIRQLPKSDSATSAIRIEGQYFKRYLGPVSNETIADVNSRGRSGSSFQWRSKGPQIFIAVLFLIIFLSIFFERNISQWKHAQNKNKNAEIYNLRVANGLMKEFDVNPELESPEMVEAVSDLQKEKLAGVVQALKKRKIFLVQTSRNKTFNLLKSTEAFLNWKRFLDSYGLKYTMSDKIPTNESVDVVILPEAKVLSQAERSDLNHLAAMGVGIFATGPVGYLDGKGELSVQPWGTEMWNLSYLTNENSRSTFPTLFSGGVRAPWWDVPPGLLLNWYPSENSFQYTSDFQSAMAYESNYQGRWRKHDSGQTFVRAIFGGKNDLPLTWLALNPPDVKAMTVAEQYYVSSTILESILWTSGAPIVKIGLWKTGGSGAFVASVDSEDQFPNALLLMKLFKEQNVPATFFVVTNLLRQDPALTRENLDDYEVASHTDDHGNLSGKTLVQQFDHIQRSRLDIEFLTGQKVNGFKPPEEGFDDVTLNAILQNHFTYIFGNQDFYRFAPVSIAEGKLLYYPRSALDDFNLISKNGVFTTSQFVHALYDDYSRVTATGGAHFLNMHTQAFGKPENATIVRDFLKKISKDSYWKTNFSELEDWWRARANLKVTVDGQGEKVLVTIRNLNQFAVENVPLEMDRRWQDKVPQVGSSSYLLTESQAHEGQMTLKRIEPGEKLSFEFGAINSRRVPASPVKAVETRK